MSRLSSEELDELLERVDIEDFLAFLNVDYKTTRGRSGVQLNLRECPRCGGRDWKVYLNAETGLGTCFHGACVGEPGFNKFSYAFNLFGQDYKATIAELKNYAQSTGWRPKVKTRPVDEVTTDVNLPPCFDLPIKGKTLKYLSDRGFTPETAEFFRWKFCKEGGYSYTMAGEKKIQDYTNRVVIPVYDIEGKLVTFQGRSIEPNPLRKYIFPPGLPGAGRYIYNANNAVGFSKVVMGEGALDVAAIKQAFDEDPTFRDIAPIGSFGKSLSMAESGGDNDQLSDLKKLKAAGLQEITMMWDGEPSTIQAAVKAALELRRYGFKVRVAELPLNCDPNEVAPAVVREAFIRSVEVTTISAIKLLSKYAH